MRGRCRAQIRYNTANPREAHRHGTPTLKQPAFNWNVTDKYLGVTLF